MKIKVYQRGDLKVWQKYLGETKGRIALETSEMLTERVRESIAGWTSSSPYNLSRGLLAASFKPSIVHTGMSSSGLSGATVMSYGTLSRSKYAHIHDQGGTIRPVRRKFLTIPLTAEARSKSALAYGDTLHGPAKIFGSLLLFKKVGRSKDIIKPQFLLRTSVTIKPKGYLEKALQKAKPEIRNITHNFIKRAIMRSEKNKGVKKWVRHEGIVAK